MHKPPFGKQVAVKAATIKGLESPRDRWLLRFLERRLMDRASVSRSRGGAFSYLGSKVGLA